MAERGISVVMPTYNRASFIAEALDSIAAQTRPPLEVLVVDDRSTDDTRARVESHPLGPRLRYRLQPENRGASIARNAGVEMARGDLIVFLDSDDLLEPDHHETVLRILDDAPDVGLLGCDCALIGPAGERLHTETWTTVQSRIKRHPIASGRRSLTDIFLFSTPFPGMTVRRDLYQAIGGLDQEIFPLDDYDLQLRVAATERSVYYLHASLARYRRHEGSESGTRQAVRLGWQKLRLVERALARHPSVLGPIGRARRGEMRRELALSLLSSDAFGAGTSQLLRSLVEDPRGFGDLGRIAFRRLSRIVRA